eukprot:PhM_4_TR6813/c0_g1_i1/m.8571
MKDAAAEVVAVLDDLAGVAAAEVRVQHRAAPRIPCGLQLCLHHDVHPGLYVAGKVPHGLRQHPSIVRQPRQTLNIRTRDVRRQEVHACVQSEVASVGVQLADHTGALVPGGVSPLVRRITIFNVDNVLDTALAGGHVIAFPRCAVGTFAAKGPAAPVPLEDQEPPRRNGVDERPGRHFDVCAETKIHQRLHQQVHAAARLPVGLKLRSCEHPLGVVCVGQVGVVGVLDPRHSPGELIGRRVAQPTCHVPGEGIAVEGRRVQEAARQVDGFEEAFHQRIAVCVRPRRGHGHRALPAHSRGAVPREAFLCNVPLNVVVHFLRHVHLVNADALRC